MKHISMILIVMLSMSSGCGSDDSGTTSWQLVWSDEFDGEAGTAINAANWNFDLGTDWGNQQLEYDTDRTQNVQLDGNGNLAIIARRENYQGRAYTSGRITTANKFEQQYGRIEASIKLPFGAGIWPAFWMLGADFDAVGWPQCGEIDIMEYRGQQPTIVHGSLHGPGYSGGSPVTSTYTLTNDRYDNDFHLFAVEWRTDRIDFYVDNILYQSVSPDDVNGEWVYDHPFFLILNVAVGGNFLGPPNDDTIFPQTMLVDYVRVYEGS